LHFLETVLSEFLPVLAAVGTPALALTLIIVLYFPHVARAVMILVAGIVAVVTGDKDRRESCHEVLDKVTCRGGGPPAWPRRMTFVPCRLPGVRDQLGKVGGALMSLAAAAALGYLITSRAVGEPSPPLKWPVWPYYLCGAMFVVGGLLYATARGKLPGFRRPALTVKIMGDSQFENWKHIALIAALHVQVKNTTDKPVLVSGYAYTSDSGGDAPWDSQVTGDQAMSVKREIYRRDEMQQYGQPLRHFARITPGQTISGWFLIPVNRPPGGGTPACTVIVKDDVSNQYRATLSAREPQVYGS